MKNKQFIAIKYLLITAISISGCSRINDNPLEQEFLVKSLSASEQVIKTKLGKSRSLSPNFMCYNVNSTQVANWQDEKFTNAVNSLNPTSLRIPGGDVGNYWNWQRGGLIEYTNALPSGLPFFLRFRARQYTAGKLPNFKAGLEATNTDPIFVVNMLTSNLESQLEMLQSAQDLGINIKYIELGNEFYFNIPNYKKTFPNPRSYGLEAKKWAEEIKKQFPDATISVVGVVPAPEKPPRLQHWNRVMRGTVLPSTDAITLHIYNGHGLSDQSYPKESFPFFQDNEVATILGEPFRNWQKLKNDANYQAIPNNKKIWITEYNLFEDIFRDGQEKPIPRVAGSWAHGLYNLATSLLFLEEPRIELICNHSLIESSIFGAIFSSSDSFVNPADQNMTATPMALSATGSALSLLGDATKNMNSATPIEFTQSPQLQGKDSFSYSALYGWKFKNDTEDRTILLNLSPEEKALDLSNLFSNSVQYQQLSGSPKDLVNQPGVLTLTSGEVNQEIMLPAYSVTHFYQGSLNNSDNDLIKSD